jgi:hypothetical protein
MEALERTCRRRTERVEDAARCRWLVPHRHSGATGRSTCDGYQPRSCGPRGGGAPHLQCDRSPRRGSLRRPDHRQVTEHGCHRRHDEAAARGARARSLNLSLTSLSRHRLSEPHRWSPAGGLGAASALADLPHPGRSSTRHRSSESHPEKHRAQPSAQLHVFFRASRPKVARCSPSSARQSSACCAILDVFFIVARTHLGNGCWSS